MTIDRLVGRFVRLDVCLVSDAMDVLGIEGFALGLQRLSTDRRVAGRVVTVQLVPARCTAARQHLGARAIEVAGPADVIVVANDGRSNSAAWGGLLSAAASVKGVGGVVVDGLCRDVDESRELGFPVFGRGCMPLTARGRVVEAATNERVVISGVTVDPGDLVVADGSGVVFVPAARADAVVSTAERIGDKESRMMRAIREGRPITQVLDARYEAMLEEQGEEVG